jgi:hypothetical protein
MLAKDAPDLLQVARTGAHDELALQTAGGTEPGASIGWMTGNTCSTVR